MVLPIFTHFELQFLFMNNFICLFILNYYKCVCVWGGGRGEVHKNLLSFQLKLLIVTNFNTFHKLNFIGHNILQRHSVHG